MEIISTHSLTKQFGATTALRDLTIRVREGEIYGFLGLNGAGKTTLIRILLGMIRPNTGEVRLFSKTLTGSFDQWNDIGYLVETSYSYPNLSVVENLSVFYQLRKLKNKNLIPGIIEKLKLTPYAHTKARHLSLGNQQRLGLAKALMHRPKLLILDEPINGLDPEGIVEVRELLKELVREGSTVFLSSHILGEISKVANQIAIIHQGRLVKELMASDLKEQLIRKVLVQTRDNEAARLHLTQAGYRAAIGANQELEVTDNRAIEHPEKITQLLVEKGVPPAQIYVFTEDLEMYFLRTIRP